MKIQYLKQLNKFHVMFGSPQRFEESWLEGMSVIDVEGGIGAMLCTEEQYLGLMTKMMEAVDPQSQEFYVLKDTANQFLLYAVKAQLCG